MSLAGLDLVGRSELFKCSLSKCVAIAQRIVGFPDSLALDVPGALARFIRWIEAGCPSADLALSDLQFYGSDEVRAPLVELLLRVPAPVGWHGAKHVCWWEVGRGTAGWQSVVPPMRAPEGDQPHVIALCGRTADAALPSVIAHELGHSWTRMIHPAAVWSGGGMSRREWTARCLIVAKMDGITPEQVAAKQVDHERQADALAEMWGYSRSYSDELLSHKFLDEQVGAIDLANQIERDLNFDGGEPTTEAP